MKTAAKSASRVDRSATPNSRTRSSARSRRVDIPATGDAVVEAAGDVIALTHLDKLFWPDLGITKGDLLQYYADVAPVLLPYVKDRAMVMKRYPHGASGEFFFMKRTPESRPKWLQTCPIAHASGNVIDFPIVQDLASLLWIVNLGCIDLNPWYARCDDVDRPDYLHFDLDPGPGVKFAQVRDTAIVVRDFLGSLGMPVHAKTSGSKGIHLYVAIVRGPKQKEVWSVAKAVAKALETQYPRLITAEYRIAKRPRGRVLVDYNQNAWGRTLAGVYSVRPRPLATVSAPVTWREIENGVELEDFRIDNIRERIRKVGDLWKPVGAARGRFRWERLRDVAHA